MSSVIDDYEPLDIIGNGSFGVIRKVRRRSDGMLFARKELNFERMTDKDRKQIVAEVNILKDLKHENIVRYINRYVDHEARILYILMEYCGGGDLGAIIANARRQSRPLPEDQIWNYFVQMLLALHYCHVPGSRGQADVTAPVTDSSASSKQILHRDLKPENIFLSSDNEIKLGDFGLSKQIATAAFANTYVGTPYYMSPELISDKAYDTKSDIWSLGCMVYEMCALKAPFHDAQTYNELSAAIRSGRIPPLPKGYSSALSSIIKSMLNINPAMRPSTLQLLKIEQLMYAKKLIDVNKMIPEIRVKHEAIVAREKAASAREQTLVQREAELASQDAQLQADRGNLQSQKAAMDAEATQLAGHRAQLDADAALLEKARTEMAQARAEFDAQIIQAKQAYEVFTTQRDAFLEEKARWEQEVLAKMSSAPLLEDVKNKPSFRSSRYANNEETPTKIVTDPSSKLRLESGDEDTPTKSTGSRKPPAFPNLPSLPSLPTIPSPTLQRGQEGHIRKPSFLSDPPPQDQVTPRRLISSRSMTDLGSAMKGVILTETGTALPTPIRRETTPRGIGSERDQDALGEASSGAESAAERQRGPRRRSMAQSRPILPSSSTTSMIPRVPSSGSAQSTAESSSSASTAPRSAPVWDHEDEENLPSPFIKKNVDFSTYSRDRGISAASSTAPSRPASSLASKPRSSPTTATSIFSRAFKASGEAQKALARRQGEVKSGVS